MNEAKFKNELLLHDIILSDKQMEQFSTYYSLLIEWNKKINLTSIIDKEEVYLKHFFDSISPAFYFNFNRELNICDVGAGAGFPSIPLLIVFPKLHVTIIDSLKKRITFLEELKAVLNLSNLHLVHGRAEDIGKSKQYREHFDIVVSRAVAKLNVLAEYCIPLCKVTGHFIALKGVFNQLELKESINAIDILGGRVVNNNQFYLPFEKSERSIIEIEKHLKTPNKYPRKAGTPSKKPL